MNADEHRFAAASDGRRATSDRTADRSGYDLDLCGDGIERPRLLVPTPGGEEACPLKADGQCPTGCGVCVAFAEELETHHGGTEDTEK